MLAVLADLVVTAIFTAFLLVATSSQGDAVPRPITLAALYGSTAIVGYLGVTARRRSLVVAAALPLIPGALLAFSGVTLVFLIPAGLFLATAARIPTSAGSWAARARGVGLALSISSLIVAAGWAALIGLTESGCYTLPDGSGCGSGLTSVAGVAVGLGLLALAIAIAAVAAKGRPPAPGE